MQCRYTFMSITVTPSHPHCRWLVWAVCGIHGTGPSWRALTHGGTPRAAPRPPGQLCGEHAAARSEAVIMATP